MYVKDTLNAKVKEEPADDLDDEDYDDPLMGARPVKFEQNTSKKAAVFSPKKKALQWASKSRYDCQFCETEDVSDNKNHKRLAFIWHLKKVHRKVPMDILAKMDSGFRKNKCTVACQICNQKLIWDSFAIQNHVQIFHKLDLTAYYVDFVKPAMYEQSRKALEDAKVKYSSDFVKRAKQWATVCTFRCKICDFKCTNKAQFISHIWNMHDHTVELYTAKYMQLEVETHRLVCKLCQVKVPLLWDYSVLENHMKVVHNTNVVEYYKSEGRKQFPGERRRRRGEKEENDDEETRETAANSDDEDKNDEEEEEDESQSVPESPSASKAASENGGERDEEDDDKSQTNGEQENDEDEDDDDSAPTSPKRARVSEEPEFPFVDPDCELEEDEVEIKQEQEDTMDIDSIDSMLNE